MALQYLAGSRRVGDSPEWWQPMIWKIIDNGPKIVVWESPGVFFSSREKAAASASNYLAESIAEIVARKVAR